jgi:hypothetical protein
MHVMSRSKIAVILSVAALNLSAAALYDETSSVDLSNSGLAPTALAISEGENQILGTLSSSANGTDSDYFTFSVPSGLELTAIVILPGTTTGPLGTFFGVQSGNQVTVAPGALDLTGLLGFTYYLPANGNIITDLGIPSNGSTGFIPPLGPGTYSFVLQDTGEGTFNYGLNFQLLAAAPEQGPGLAGCAAAFAVIAGLNRLKHTSSKA